MKGWLCWKYTASKSEMEWWFWLFSGGSSHLTVIDKVYTLIWFCSCNSCHQECFVSFSWSSTFYFFMILFKHLQSLPGNFFHHEFLHHFFYFFWSFSHRSPRSLLTISSHCSSEFSKYTNPQRFIPWIFLAEPDLIVMRHLIMYVRRKHNSYHNK